jgi:hypothetical protein
MMISGHKTRSVLDRHNVVDERDLLLAEQRLERLSKVPIRRWQGQAKYRCTR